MIEWPFRYGNGETAGEYAGNGLGGWLNGRGDDSMRLPEVYAKIAAFFEACAWWRAEPSPGLIRSDAAAYCLAEPGRLYLLYLPEGAAAEAMLEEGTYDARWYDPATGQFEPSFALACDGFKAVRFAYPEPAADRALMIERIDERPHP